MTTQTPSPSPTSIPVTQTWIWQGFPITYQAIGSTGPAVVMVHGFGASLGHWRKNLPVLGTTCQAYAIDLLGFGGSAKPSPGPSLIPGQQANYTIETWAQQVADFCREVVGQPVLLIGNSIGCIVSMQTAIDFPETVLGVALLNCSLRLLHDHHRASQPWYKQIGVPLLQQLLQVRWIGRAFFHQIAQRNTVRKILLQAYKRPEAVTDELLDLLLEPASQPGSADVFIAFTAYSQGPLPEEQLQHLPCPAIILWGEADPWEPITLGEKLADYPSVQQFIRLPNVGHCPQDEAPELVNPILQQWIHEQISKLER